MGLLEEVAGAAAAVMATKKLDSDAGLLEEAAAAFAGFKAVEALEEHMAKPEEASAESQDGQQA